MAWAVKGTDAPQGKRAPELKELAGLKVFKFICLFKESQRSCLP